MPAPDTSVTPIRGLPNGTTTVVDPIRAPTPSEQQVIDKAEDERALALRSAIGQVDALIARRKRMGSDGTAGAPVLDEEQQKVVDKITYWLYLPGINEKFWVAVDRFRELMVKNWSLGVVKHSVDTVKTDHAYVFADDRARGVFFCLSVYFKDNPLCQREVLMHEYFHFVGLGHHYTTDQTDEALECAHHIAELVFDMATGCTGGCKTAAVCR